MNRLGHGHYKNIVSRYGFLLGMLAFVMGKGILGYVIETQYQQSMLKMTYWNMVSFISSYGFYFLFGVWVVGFFALDRLLVGKEKRERTIFYFILCVFMVLPIGYCVAIRVAQMYQPWYQGLAPIVFISGGMAVGVFWRSCILKGR